ncbi:MAG: OmpH family outer membrane protein [Planctomycetota bacterium]
MNQTLRVLATLFLLAGMASLLGALQGAPEPSETVRYVDMQRCFDAYKPVLEEMTRLKEGLRKKTEDFKKREEDIRQRQNELSVLDVNSAEYQEKAFQLESDRMVLERDKKFILDELDNQRMALFIRAYRAVQDAAAKVGAREGFGAILMVPGDLDKLPPTQKAAVEDLQSRSVLWTNPNYDVTQQVIDTLDGGS